MYIEDEVSQSAIKLREYLLNGGALTPIESPFITDHGEVCYLQAELALYEYCGEDVSYSTGFAVAGGLAGVAFGLAASAVLNSYEKHKAEQQAAVQWRYRGNVLAALTDRRMCTMGGASWVSWWHDALMNIHTEPAQQTMLLGYEGVPAIALAGPVAPYFTVALSHCRMGTPCHVGHLTQTHTIGQQALES